MRRVGVAWVAWTAVIACGMAAGRAAADEAAAQQRARIASDREAVQQRYDAKERDCAQRFVVTSCMNAARKERRDALVPLRQDELRIDAVERQQRAAARLDEIETKRRADAAREAAEPPEVAKAPTASAAPNLPARPIIGPSPPRAVISAAERERREAASQARFDANQAEAQRRRQAAEDRNARRAAAGKVARPLPVPPAASAP